MSIGLSSITMAQTPLPDSLLILIRAGKAKEVITYLKPPAITPESRVYRTTTLERQHAVVLMYALHVSGDTLISRQIRTQLLDDPMALEDAKPLIEFIFRSGFKFITQRHLFEYVQRFGADFSVRHNEPRAQFSFLQQLSSFYQMSNQSGELIRLLREMDTISRGQPYLECLRDMHYGMYYNSRQHDSCVYYFENYLAKVPQWVGRPNPYFLIDENYAAKRDSGIMANGIMDYAKYYIRKGNLTKAGQLLVKSHSLIPDSSSFNLMKIQNKLTLSQIYADLVQPARAVRYAREAVAMCDSFALHRLRKTQVAAAYAYALMADQKFEEAQVEIETAYREFPRSLNCQDPLTQALRAALNEAYRHDLQSSRAWLDSANALNCERGPQTFYLENMVHGVQAMQQGGYAQASLAFNQAVQIAKDIHQTGWLKEALYRQYNNHLLSRNVEAGLQSLERYAALNDSLYRSGQDVALFDIEAGYEKTIQDETIARLDMQHQVVTARLKAQKRNMIIVLTGLLLVLGLLFLVYRLYRQVREANKLITRSNEEKNILLKEIHHRVKNNLQVISSLLKLQSGYIKDDAALQAIAEGRSRVQSMALLHQNLYREDNLTGVNMKEYFDNLIQGLFDTYNISSDRITLHKNIEPIQLDVDTVVPLGLITNELISNALKHAFPETSSGHLYIDLYEDNQTLILRVRDDGIGIAEQTALTGFGSKLIQSLSAKLEAEISRDYSTGTEVKLVIRDYLKAA